MQRISEESFQQLIVVMERVMVLSFPFKMALKKVLFETEYDRGARVLNFGETQGKVWFLLSGLFREIRMNRQALKEKTSWFWPAMNFVYTDPGFFSQQPSSRAIEVEEESRAVLISYQDWSDLKETFRETDKVTELIRGSYNQFRMEHMEDMKSLTVDERYLDKEEILDYLFPRTQLNYIADYMGMAADTLGRLRSKYLGRKR